MTLAFAVFSKLCDVANEFDQMREAFPQGSRPALVLTAVVESLDTWIDFMVRSNGIDEVDESIPAGASWEQSSTGAAAPEPEEA